MQVLILFLLHRYNTLYWILNFGDAFLQPSNTNVSNSQCFSGTLIMFPYYVYRIHSNKIEHIPAHFQKMQVHYRKNIVQKLNLDIHSQPYILMHSLFLSLIIFYLDVMVKVGDRIFRQAKHQLLTSSLDLSTVQFQ